MNQPRKLYPNTVGAVLGLPFGYFRGEKNCRAAMAVCKAKLIAARTAGDDEIAAKLSQVREFLKAKLRMFQPGHCEECGVVVARAAKFCLMHAIQRLHLRQRKSRFLPMSLPESRGNVPRLLTGRMAGGGLADRERTAAFGDRAGESHARSA